MMLNLLGSYDLDSFTDVPEPQAQTQAPRLSFSKKDQLTQNEALRKMFGGVNAFRLRISPDGRIMTLDPAGERNLTFTEVGVRTHHPLGQLLRQKGLEPPVSFVVSWAEELHCWIARYDGLTLPPGLGKPGSASSKRGKGRNH